MLVSLQKLVSDLKLKGISKDSSYGGLSLNLRDNLESRGFQIYSGKVREMISSRDSDKHPICMLHSDRLSAFDRAICLIPYKGVLITKISKHWFDFMDRLGLSHHLLDMPNDRCLMVKPCSAFKFEFIVRAYLAGSMLRDYEKGQREFYGYTLEDGLKPYQRLPHLMFTPSTKAEAYVHDVPSSKSEILARGLCTASEWQAMEEMAAHFFMESAKFLDSRSLILADTKYEFGKNLDGEICFIDEVHTPDSSRFWEKKSSRELGENKEVNLSSVPEMKDKEQIRQWLIKRGFKGEGLVPEVPDEKKLALTELYVELAERIGVSLEIDSSWSEKELLNLF